MSYAPEDAFASHDVFAADAAQAERVAFIRRTYVHLGGAILAFIGLEAYMLNTPAIHEPLSRLLVSSGLFVFIGFMAITWVARKWAHNAASPGKQYMGLALYIVAQAAFFCPLLMFASLPRFGGGSVIPTAGILTGLIFCGLTLVVFMTKADFSFLRNMLWMGGFAAMGVMVASMIMGFSLGLFFTAAMIVLMSGWILYDTSNILHHYRTDQHVGAALELFASVTILFWYIIRLLMMLTGRD